MLLWVSSYHFQKLDVSNINRPRVALVSLVFLIAISYFIFKSCPVRVVYFSRNNNWDERPCGRILWAF